MERSLATICRHIPNVSCVEGDETNLFIGTTDGQLLHLVLQIDDPDSASYEFSYLLASRQEASGSKAPKSIILLPIVQLAAVLANDCLSFYTLPEFAPASDLRKVRDVRGVIQNSSLSERIDLDGSANLTVFTHRKIRQIKVTRSVIKLIKEVEYEGCLAASQRNSIVCAATKKSYDLIDLDKRARIPLFPVVQGESNPEGSEFDPYIPHIISATPEEFMLVSGSPESPASMGIFITLEGEITRGTLMFDAYPLHTTAQYPHVLTLLSNQTMVMHDISNQELVQTFPAEDVIGIGHANSEIPIVSRDQLDLLFLDPQTGTAKDEDEKIPSPNLNLARQVSKVFSRSLVYTRNSVQALIEPSHFVIIDKTLDRGDVLGALSAAEQMSRNSAAALAVQTYHEMAYIHQKAGLLCFKDMLFDDAMDNFKKGGLDPRHLIRHFPEFNLDITGVLLYSGLANMMGTIPDVDEIISINLAKTVDDDETMRELKLIMRSNALELLRRYVMSIRDKRGFGSTSWSPDTSALYKTLDVVLLKILLDLDRNESKTMLEEFLRSDIEDMNGVANLLRHYERWQALAHIQEILQNHYEALSIWRSLEASTYTDPGYSSDAGKHIGDYLLVHLEADLLEEFGLWLLRNFFDQGVRVFSYAMESELTSWSFRNVLDLLRADTNDSATYDGFLEYVVLEQRIADTALSHELVQKYAQQVTRSLNAPELRGLVEKSISDYRALPVPKESFLAHKLDLQAQTKELGSFNTARNKLIKLLQGEIAYDAECILEIILQQKSLLVVERILLYGRLSKHAESLDLLVHDLKDFDSSEIYCYHGGISLSQIKITSDKEETVAMRKLLFPMLFAEYLKLSDHSLQFTQGSQLLNRWANYMDVADVLDQIPDHWSVDLISAFLSSALAKLAANKREAQIRRSLIRAQSKREAAKIFVVID